MNSRFPSCKSVCSSLAVTLALLAQGCGETTTDPSESRQDQAGVAKAESTLHLADFQVFPQEDNSWKDGQTIFCEGKTKGYIYTNESFGNGVISFEYRYPQSTEGADSDADAPIPNTGLLLLIEPPHKKWPRCIEAQGKQSEAGQLKGNGGVSDLSPEFDEAALVEAIKPPGTWNSVSVTVSASEIVAQWNGQQTARCQRNGLSAGPFGLQSEGNPVEFRNIRFVPAKDSP